MIRANVHEVKTFLSRYLSRVKKGERVLICHRNHPVAELRVVESPRTAPRPIGLAKGEIKITETFFKPLPKPLLDAFSGRRA